MDKSFPSYATSTTASAHLPFSYAIVNALDDLLTDADLTFTGLWFFKRWVNARAGKWHQQRKEEATYKTIYMEPLLPPSKDRIYLEWCRNRSPLR